MRWYKNWIMLRLSTYVYIFALIIRNKNLHDRVCDYQMKLFADQYYLKYGEKIE